MQKTAGLNASMEGRNPICSSQLKMLSMQKQSTIETILISVQLKKLYVKEPDL